MWWQINHIYLIREALPHKLESTVTFMTVNDEQSPVGWVPRLRLRDKDLPQPFDGDVVVGPAVFRRRKLPGLVTLECFKPLLLNAFPLKDNKRRARFARGRDTLEEGGPDLPSIAFSSNNLPSFGPEDYSIRSGALGDTSFVGVVTILGLNLEDDGQPKEVEPWLNYLRFGPIDPAEVHLATSDTMNLGVSNEESPQPFLSERWRAFVRSGDPRCKSPYLEMG
jgi:hypothetical protein